MEKNVLLIALEVAFFFFQEDTETLLLACIV